LDAVVSDPLGRCDLDLNGPSFTSIVFIAALFFLVVTMIFVVFVAIVGNPSGCGLGCGYWQSSWLWWLWS
jgi:hypothetical protein